VLYRAKEHRTLELLRNLTLEQVVPYMQRITRGALAREFKRRALRSKALLRKAINEASVVADLDAALVEHTENMRMMLCIFSIPFPELAEVKTLRAAMQLWLDLELEITKLLAEHAKGGDAADAVADAIEVCMYIACMQADIHVCARACARGGRATAPRACRWRCCAPRRSRTCVATRRSGPSTRRRARCASPRAHPRAHLTPSLARPP